MERSSCPIAGGPDDEDEEEVEGASVGGRMWTSFVVEKVTRRPAMTVTLRAVAGKTIRILAY